MRRSVAAVLLLVAATIGPVVTGGGAGSARAQEAPHGVREWNQSRGNAQRSGHAPFAPLSMEPAVAWRKQLTGALVAEPVTWGGIVYVASQDDAYVQVSALHARTGEEIASRRLERGTWAALATWEGTVIVVQDGVMRGFPLKDGKLGNGWRKKGAFAGAPCVVDGLVLLHDGSEIKMFDARTGRDLAKADWLPRGDKAEDQDEYGMLAVRETAGHFQVAGAHRTKADKQLRLHVLELEDVGGRKPGFGSLLVHDLIPVAQEPDDQARRDLILGWLADDKNGSWLFTARAKKGWSGSLAVDPDESRQRKMGDIITPPGATAGFSYGFGLDSSLHRLGADRTGRALTERGSLPQGARASPAAASGGTVVFGNWAMDVETGRTLWVLPDLPQAEVVVPVADAHVVIGTATGELICLADPAAAAEVGADVATAGTEEAPGPPADGDGVFLADGRKILGSYETNGETVVVKTASGETETFPIDDVAIGEVGGDVLLRGEEPRVLAAWQNVLDGVFVRGLRTAFESYRKERLVSDCRRVLADMRRYGAGHTLLEGYDASLVGMAEHPNADMKKKRLGPEEDAARAAALVEVDKAVTWCEQRLYGGAATALLDYSLNEGVDEGKVEARAAKLLPSGFPWPDDKSPGLLWVRWARQMVPAGGEFLPKSDAFWGRARSAPWNAATLGFRTKNIVLFSRCHDLDIVGMCLRVSEGTVRALENMLGNGTGRQPLDVRLHKNREEYLAEKTPSGQAMPWSAGYYAPGEGVSRFYVPGAENSVEPVSRDLSKTLAHELTHHWLSERWIGRSNGGRAGSAPGYWIVEGFARFVEDQAVEMGRRAGRMDDTTVNSLDAASQVARQDRLMNTAELVAMTQVDFSNIPEKHVADVKLRNSTGTRRLDVRALFYEQSGSLVFFLMNRCGDEGRDALVKYMRSHYFGSSPKDPSTAFGFEDGADMHAKFVAFLLALLK